MKMILGVSELHRLVKEQRLVEGLCERELQNPEGVGFDLRLGEIYELSGRGFLGVDERETPKTRLVAKYEDGKKTSFILKPGSFHLVKTIERVNTPENLVGLIFPRTTLYRSGLAFFCGQDAPGYCGELIFGVANLGSCEVEIELGARICHILFLEVKGSSNLYRGQWHSGRVSTREREQQV